MSKVIDERVVSMQFDNKQFESNVRTTMSTLEKLKSKLNLSGAAKGLEGINSAASKCNLSPLGTAVENVKSKFSALEVMSVTALANITNSAVNAGKRLVESLTIAPVTTGFNEYELKMGSIQTIMASTGESLATVNEYLNELNTYSDQTIYSFQDMTQNIGKFTNAGVKLEDAVLAIKGIANEAAVSGANANEASRAMYNFAQALSTGYIQRIDWKSIELANMATVEFKEQLLNSAVAMGTVEKNAKGMWKAVGDDEWYNTSQMFIESLDEQWLTSEVLIDTLKDYADANTEIGKKASEAATQVKTFSMLMDTLKESAQSGWAQSWETIVGDFDESKNLFTKLSDVIGGWIGKSADRRNNILSEVLDSNWEKAIKQLNKVGISTEKYEDAIKKVVKGSSKAQEALGKQGKTLDELIKEHGSLQKVFESGALSSDILTEAVDVATEGLSNFEIALDRVLNRGKKGDDVKQMQKILKGLGYDLGEFGENLDGLDGSFGPVTQAAVKAFQEAKGLKVDGIVGPETTAALEKAAEELNKANEESKGLVGNIKDLVKNVDNLGGRQKLIKAISTLWEKLGKVVDAVKKGFDNIFGDVDIADTVIKIIDKFSKWVDEINITKDVLDDIESIIGGIFAAIQTGAILGSGVFGVLYKIVTTATRFVGLDLVSVLGNVGDALIKFRKFLINDNALANFLENLGTKLAAGLEIIYGMIGEWATAIKEWFGEFLKLEKVATIIESLSKEFGIFREKIGTWFGGFGTIFGDFFKALGSLDNFSFDAVWAECKKLWTNLVDHFSSIGGIFDPLIEGAKKLGLAFVDQLSLTEPFATLIEWIKKARQAYKDWCDGLEGSEDLPQRVGEAIGNGLFNVLESVGKIMADVIKAIVSAITGIPLEVSDEAESMGHNIINGLVKGLLNGIKFVIEAIIEVGKTLISRFAEMLGIHSPSTVFIAFGGFIIAGLIIGLLSSIPSVGEALGKLGSYISEHFGTTISEIGDKLKNFFGNLDFGKVSSAFWGLSAFFPNLGILNVIAAISNAFSTFGTNVSEGFGKATTAAKTGAQKLGNGLSTAFGVVKDIVVGIVTFLRDNFSSIAAIIGGFLLVKAVTKLADVVLAITTVVSKISDAISGMFKSFGKAAELVGKGIFILLLAFAVKELAGAFVELADLSWGEIGKGAAVIGGLAIVLTGIAIAIGFLAKQMNITSAASMQSMAVYILALAAGIGILAYALTLMDDIDASRMWQNIGAIGVLAVGLAGVAAIMSKVKGEVTKGSIAMIAVSAAILILVFALTKLNALVIDDPIKTIGALMAIAAGLALVALTSKGINKGAALGMIGMVISIWLFTKLLKSIVKNKDTLKEGYGVILLVMAVFAGIMLATRLMGKGETSMAKIGTGIFMLAMALLVVVGAMKMIAKMDDGGLIKALAVVTVVMLVFAVLIASTKFAGEHAMRAGVMLIMMSTALLILAGVLAVITLIAKHNPDELMQAAVIVGIMMLLFERLIKASEKAQKTMGAIVAITAAIGIVVAAIGLLSLLAKDPATLWQAVGAMSAVMLVLAGLIHSLKFIQSGKAAIGSIATLIVLTGCIALLAACIKQLATLEPERALGAAGALSLVMLGLAGSLAIMNKFRKYKPEHLVGTLIVVAAVMGLFSLVLRGMDGIDPVGALANAAAMSLLVLALAKSLTIMNKFGKTKPKPLIETLLAMALIVGVLGGIIFFMDGIDPAGALANAASLSALIVALSTAVFILGKSGKVADSAMEAAGKMVIVLAGIAAVLALCQLMGVDAAFNNVASLGALLLVISAACLILSKAKGIDNQAITATMIMGVVLAEIAAVLALCQVMGVDAAFNNVASLGALLLVISAACLILSKCTYVSNSAIKAAMAMGVVLAEISVVLWLCQKMGVDVALNNVMALSTLLIVLSAACLILDHVKSVSPGALLAVAALGLIMLELGWVLSKILEMNIGPCMNTVLTLSALLLAMSLITFILSKIGPTAIAAIPAAVGVMGVIAVIGGIALAIGGLMSLISPETIEKWSVGLQSFMDFIVILATGLGEAIGGLIGGTLEGIGQGLSDFMTNLQGFIEGAKSIDPSMAEGMKALGVAILAITTASILDGLSRLFGLGSMDELGASMASFGSCMISFAQSISSLTEEDIARIKMAAEAGKAMAEMESVVPKQGGWWQTIAGSSDMADFGARMEAFGGSLVAFSSSITDLTEDDIAKIKLAADAGSALAGLESGIPKQGGWWQEIAGASDMADFGARMEAFGGSLVAFSGSVADLTEDNIAKITMTADAGNAMAALEDSIPRKGGWWQDIVGEKDIATFGSSMVAFGDAIVKYSKKVSGLDENAATNIENSKAAAKALVGVYDVLPEDDGWWGKIAGETDASAFGTGMYDLAKGLAKYATAAAELDEDAADDIKNSKDAVEALKDIAGVITGEGIFNAAVGNCANVATFGTSMVSLAGSLKDYSSAVSEGIDVTSIENSKTAIIAMADAAKALPNDGGLVGLIAGENGDITTFGSKMVTLAGQVMTYAATVSAITAEELAAIALSSLAISAMAAAAKALPNEGGLQGLLAGENGDITGFGSKMVTLAGQVMTYASTVASITEDDVTAIRNSKTAIVAMTSAAKALPNEGGLAGLLAGENGDITGFGIKMVALATSLNMYIASISGITEESIGLIILSGNAIAALVGVGIRASVLAGVDITDVSMVSTNLLTVANLLVQYTNKILGINETTVTRIVMSGNAIYALAGVASKATLLNNFGSGVSDAAINQLGKLVNLAKGMADVNFGPMSAFAQNLAALGEAGVTQFVNAFTGSYDRVSAAGQNMVNMLCQGVQSGSDNVVVAVTLVTGYMLNTLTGSITLFHTSGAMLMGQLASGIATGSSAVAISVTTALNAALTSIRGQYTSWYNTGTYLVGGFASGISENTFIARAAAVAMAQSALDAANKVLKINSPSKVFRDVVGMAVPEGFAAGIDKFTYMVTDSTAAMGDTALQGAKKAIAKLADYVDTDIDTQPTIRPVLDLSDVSSGISTMGNLFDMTPSVGVLANVGSISSMMNNSRYGSNDDVVDAINKLNKGLDNIGNTTYSINGITYDDGSSTSDAVRSLVRAIGMERRT